MKKIEGYEFGKIVIEGKIYTHDLIVYPDKIKENWWRKQGHSLCMEDIEEVFEYNPEILVIGTGYSGVMDVPENVIKEIERRGVKIEVYLTRDAVKKFNEYIKKGKKVVCALHLTC